MRVPASAAREVPLGRQVLVRVGTDEGLGRGLALHLAASTPGVPLFTTA